MIHYCQRNKYKTISGGGRGSVGRVMVFNDISVISWLSVLLVEETGVTGDNLYRIMLYRVHLA
jgi:hypothetical protein